MTTTPIPLLLLCTCPVPFVSVTCDGIIVNDKLSFYFTADCSSAIRHGSTCRLIYVNSLYAGGSVTCNEGSYDMVAAGGMEHIYSYNITRTLLASIIVVVLGT
jgi:hypothetical protein